MTNTADLLIELGSEELPPKALKKLSDAFTLLLEEGLAKHDLSFASVQSFATPRRLAIRVDQLAVQQQDKSVERRGPAVQAAYDQAGNPTKAAEGFARSCGTTVDQLETLETDKGSWLVFRSVQQGQQASAIIPELIEQALNKLPIPKRMTWGAEKVAFVRPVHWLVVMLGNEVIPCEILGLSSGNTSFGHRFHHPDPVAIDSPGSYQEQMRSAYVVADFAERQQTIKERVAELAKNQSSGEASIDDGLLEEVTGLVEWPVPLMGNFDDEFLQVPQEALISAMQEHQKYFPVLDADGKILPHFITVSNIESQDPKKVISGNERVIRPRLSDARFFFETDKKKTLEQHNEPLEKVVFEAQLGTVYEKAERVAGLAGFIAGQIGSNTDWAQRAGLLSKADLATEMVGEFPDLQGIMGYYYALHQNEPEEVARALNEQYLPRFAGDALPETDTGAAVAIAEKLDTLVGILGIGKHPTGDKDPYGLRRLALGLLRIIVGKQYNLDLVPLIEQAITAYGDKLSNGNVADDALNFLQGRYMTWYQEEGVSTDIIKAVLEVNPTRPLDFQQRVRAVQHFKTLPEAEALAAANKRVGNILAKSDLDLSSVTVDETLFSETRESQLHAAIQQQAAGGDYHDTLVSLASLKEPVDEFFDHVMVNADDEAIKANRLALLKQLHQLFINIADISQLQ
ncbi:MAG: glycine--tRNA ligase subunit beta [Ketobacteraceae bacterium]|nr:glycine--tRNA ligase subunit beta [Ketobacteraceae bacterium]